MKVAVVRVDWRAEMEVGEPALKPPQRAKAVLVRRQEETRRERDRGGRK